MGNSHSVPQEGGERLPDYLQRLFHDKTNNADHLVMHALQEEHKHQQQEENGTKGVWERMKERSKNDRQDFTSDEELLANFKPRENEFTEVRRLHRNTCAKREIFKRDNPYSKAAFEKWRNHQETVISSIRATMADRREGSSLYQNGVIPQINTFTPRRKTRSGESPIFEYHSTPTFPRKNDDSNARNIKDISEDTVAPWTHTGYGNEPWVVDSVIRWTEQNRDVWSSHDFDQESDDSSKDLTERDTRKGNKECHLEEPDEHQDKVLNDEDYSNEHRTFNNNSCNHYDNTDGKDTCESDEIKTHVPSNTGHNRKREPESLDNIRDSELNDYHPKTFDRRSEKDGVNTDELGIPVEKERQHVSLAQKAKAFFMPTFRSSRHNKDTADLASTDKHLDDGGDKKAGINKTDRQELAKQAEAFFVSLDLEDHYVNIQDGLTNRLANKVKLFADTDTIAEKSTKKADALFIPACSPLSDSDANGTLQDVRNHNINNRFARNRTQYGSVEHNNEIKSDNEIRQKRLGDIQTKVDSWKTNETLYNKSSMRDYEVAQQAPQYGSVAHNNLIKRDNAKRKQKIDAAKTKVDSWKINETEDIYQHPYMKQYKLATKPAQYGSVEHSNHIMNDNALRKKKLGSITTTLDTWETKETDHSYLQHNMRGYEVIKARAEYGSLEHNNQIKRDNALRKTRIDQIQTNLDTWNTPNPGSKYSLQRKDEWEPVFDPGRYGSVAHFHQIKSDNATSRKHLSTIHSNLDTWNTPTSGSKYSLQRKDDWEPVYDTRKYGSIAHYHQVKQTHSDNKHMLQKASTKLCTWQPKSKMDLLNIPNQKKIDIFNPNMKSLMRSVKSAKSRIDTGSRRNDHIISSWSRNVPDNTSTSSSTVDPDDNGY